MKHVETHKSHRIGWLRAAVLGANDGIISTASLLLGVTAAGADFRSIIAAGIAGLVAGAMSMAAGEYVSVSSQSDTEQADIKRERKELADDPEHEHTELANIYKDRGLDTDLAKRVATKLMQHDALGAHMRDELGISHISTARPLQAAGASALTFAIGAALPLLVTILSPTAIRFWAIIAASLACLVLLGLLAGRAGGASMLKSALRVTFWGAMAMTLTAAIGALVGTII